MLPRSLQIAMKSDILWYLPVAEPQKEKALSSQPHSLKQFVQSEGGAVEIQAQQVYQRND